MKSKITEITADASFRKFYRVTLNKKSKILILSKKDKHRNLFIYASINKFLKSKNILTPKLFEYNFKKGKILIEDFGDMSFYKVLIKQKDKLKTYKKIIDLLIKIQKIKPKYTIKNINNKSVIINKYTNDYLHKESNLFFDWYLPLIFNKKKTLTLKKKIKKILSKLYKKINFSKSHFVHRDYHVENLIKVGNKIGVIDSQDALIGNAAYDLASIVDDVRIKTSKKLKGKIYKYYLKKTLKVYKNNQKKFNEDFNILSVQRSLKIIGIFCRLFKRDKKAKYLKLIPHAWKLMEFRLKEKIFSDLKKVLDYEINKKIRKKNVFK
jgi:N-acetylmuramate 1-kinase